MTNAALGNVNVAPGGVTTVPYTTNVELLASTVGWTQDGVTLAVGQGVLAVGTPLVKYEDGTAGPAGATVTREVAESATFTAADNTVTTPVDHDLVVGDKVSFANVVGGAGITANTVLFVQSVPSATTFTVAATSGGAAIDITSDGTSGVVTQTETDGTVLIGFLRRETDTGVAGDLAKLGNVVYRGILKYDVIKAANGGADLTSQQLSDLGARVDADRDFLIF